MPSGWLMRLRGLVSARREREELDEELRYHLEAETERNMAAGMSEEDARAAARRAMGNLLAVRERAREAYGWTWLDHVVQDLRSAVRALLRDRAVSGFVIITLALGLGATAAVFSLADRLFVEPPAGVVDPGGVRRLYLRTNLTLGGVTAMQRGFVYAAAAAIDSALAPRARTAEYVPPGQFSGYPLVPTGSVNLSYASADYFSVLGVRPFLGRFFDPSETRLGRSADALVAVLSYGYWQRRFGDDRTVLGRVVTLADRAYTVIGVAQRGFSGTDLDATDVWVPLAGLPGGTIGGVPWYRYWRFYSVGFSVLVRPQRDVRSGWIAAVATAVYRRGERAAMEGLDPDTTGAVLTGPLLEALGPTVAPAPDVAITWRLIGVALIVLLVACANVANLLLLRAMRRRREIAVCAALGISRGRLVRQLLVEAVVLSAAGGVAALVLAAWGGRVLRTLLLPSVHWASGDVFDQRLLLFGVALTLITGLAAGLVPALRSSRPDLATELKSGPRDGGAGHSRLRAGLTVAQVSLSVLLLVGAGLFLRSLQDVRGIDLGYQMDRLVMGRVFWLKPDGAYDYSYLWKHAAAVGNVLSDVAARLADAPGVEGAAVASSMPMHGFAMTEWFLGDGREVPSPDNREPAAIAVSPGFFRTTGVTLVRGRAFDDRDHTGSPGVVIVNETAARLYWPGADAIGKCLRLFRATSPCLTVVGVTEDAHLANVIEPQRVVLYTPLAQQPISGGDVVIARTAPGEQATVAAAIRRTLRSAFPGAAPPEVEAGSELIGSQYRPWETGTALFGVLGLLALLVAAVGVYSVVAYSVSQRTHEMGVRTALGARVRDVVSLVLGGSLRLVGVGVVVGVGLALILGRLVASLLYGVSAHDPIVLAAVAVVLLAVGLLAAALPAWRAAKVDPVRALGAE